MYPAHVYRNETVPNTIHSSSEETVLTSIDASREEAGGDAVSVDAVSGGVFVFEVRARQRAVAVVAAIRR